MLIAHSPNCFDGDTMIEPIKHKSLSLSLARRKYSSLLASPPRPHPIYNSIFVILTDFCSLSSTSGSIFFGRFVLLRSFVNIFVVNALSLRKVRVWESITWCSNKFWRLSLAFALFLSLDGYWLLLFDVPIVARCLNTFVVRTHKMLEAAASMIR